MEYIISFLILLLGELYLLTRIVQRFNYFSLAFNIFTIIIILIIIIISWKKRTYKGR